MQKTELFIVKAIVAAFITATNYLYGGWNEFLGILLVFTAFDYVSGVLVAARKGRLSSNVGAFGIARKVGMFVVVAVAFMFGKVLGQADIMRDLVTGYFIANEGLSIIENAADLGLKVPAKLKGALEAFHEDKGGRL